MTILAGLLPSEVDDLVVRFELQPYRATQLLQAIHRDFAQEVDAIRQWPADARKRLRAEGYETGILPAIRTVTSDDGETTKSLLQLPGGTLVETVLMQYPEAGKHPRSTVCVSTQAGCAMGCVFCATGQMGFERNLSAGEIVAQVLNFASLLKERNQHVTNVVFMGMGEPLANYNETIRAVRILTDPRAFGLGQRSITISTVGIVRAIDRLATEDLQIGLAISLHAPNEELRRRLVPTAGPTSVRDLVRAAKRYFKRTRRRVTFEYALIADINDSVEIAEELAVLLRGSGAHVNLIPVNPTAGGFQRPPRSRVVAFERTLQAADIACTVRVEKGSEIAAACGQLRTSEDRAREANVLLVE
jgi:23S rRNA (adenine2503-C2)-methyltransferase